MPSVTVGANVWSVLKGSILKDGSHGTDVYNAGPHTVKCLYNSSWVNIAVGSSLPPISNGSPTTYKVRRPDGGGECTIYYPEISLNRGSPMEWFIPND